MTFRQSVVDAAVVELTHQMGSESVAHHGTSVDVDGSFKMARVAEAIIKAAVIHNDAIVEEVAKHISPRIADWQDYTDKAIDAITAVRGSILAQLDPLP